MKDMVKVAENNGSNSSGNAVPLSALVFSLSAQELSLQSGLYNKVGAFGK
ncbi:hypothetical protein [Pedobacter polaris]|nr:hypothetical protein [Pedobacter polaris]